MDFGSLEHLVHIHAHGHNGKYNEYSKSYPKESTSMKYLGICFWLCHLVKIKNLHTNGVSFYCVFISGKLNL